MSFRWRARRPNLYQNEFRLDQVVCAVMLWLIEMNGLSRVHVWMDRHCTQNGRAIAAADMTSPRHPARLTKAARRTFLALGCMTEDTAADLDAHQFRDGHHSKHEAIQAFLRIEETLRRW